MFHYLSLEYSKRLNRLPNRQHDLCCPPRMAKATFPAVRYYHSLPQGREPCLIQAFQRIRPLPQDECLDNNRRKS